MWNDLVPIIHNPDYILVSIVFLLKTYFFIEENLKCNLCLFFCNIVFFLSISALSGFIDLSPCTTESCANSLFTYRKQYWSAPDHFGTFQCWKRKSRLTSAKNHSINRNDSKNCVFKIKTDRTRELLSFHLYPFIAVFGQKICRSDLLNVVLKTGWPPLSLIRIWKSMHLSSEGTIWGKLCFFKYKNFLILSNGLLNGEKNDACRSFHQKAAHMLLWC